MTEFTDEEKAEAADRLIDTLEQARETIHAARKILYEGRSNRTTSPNYPKFGLSVDGVGVALDTAVTSLHEAHRIVAVYAYDQHRKMHKERRDVWSSLP